MIGALSRVSLCLSLFAYLVFAAAVVEADEIDVKSDRRFNAVAWTQNAAEYRMAARQSYRLAALQLDKGLSDLSWTADMVQRQAGGYENKRPAIILDVDETVLDNSAYSARGIINAEEHSASRWSAWVNEEKAKAISGALEFINYARSKDVVVFYVTNRRDEVRQSTVNNLRAIGFPVATDYVLTRNDEQGRAGNKVSRRAMVAENHRIILLIGDNMGDFCAGMDTTDQQARNELAHVSEKMLGHRWIILPNPMYGGWEGALSNAGQALHPVTTGRRVPYPRQGP